MSDVPYEGAKTLELAQLLITPGILLTAFIFFWKQAKTSSDELKRELKSDMKEFKEELKVEITSVRKEVSSIRVEIHDMNGRLGRVEGLLKATNAG